MKKKVLSLGTLLLGCCLAAAAQMGTTPSTAQQDQGGQSSAMTTTVQGCLSQSPEGGFMLASNAGDLFQLRGDTSKLNTYLGKQVRVYGTPLNNSASNANAMAADTADASTGVAQQFNVSLVQEIANTCALSK